MREEAIVQGTHKKGYNVLLPSSRQHVECFQLATLKCDGSVRIDYKLLFTSALKVALE